MMEHSEGRFAFTPAETEACRGLASLALEEDLDAAGDLTAQAIIAASRIGTAVLVSRRAGVLAGLPAVELVFGLADPTLLFEAVHQDGSDLRAGDRIAVLSGRVRSILAGERTALNFLQRLSGIATLTRRYVDAAAEMPCRILDTRKTTPGWRLLEKYAVRCGGGHNHRMGLYDGILIKDNHLAALAGLSDPVSGSVRLARQQHGTSVPLEVEVDTLEQLDLALKAKPDMVLLDNMPAEMMREAVRRRDETAPTVLLEASGGITLETVRAIAATGVDRISVGALTHSAPALDISLDYLQ